MPETYQPRKKSKQSTVSKNILSKLGRLFLKQTAASLVCIICILGIHHAPQKSLSGWADALGNALRYETDLSFLSELKERFFPPEEAEPLPESDLPLTEH